MTHAHDFKSFLIPDSQGYTPLMYAVSIGCYERVLSILSVLSLCPSCLSRALSYSDPLHGMTVLHFAVENNQLNIAKLLISKGSNINTIDFHGRTPLTLAITNLSQALENIPNRHQNPTQKPNPSPNSNSNSNSNHLIKQYKDQLAFIQHLLENGAQVNVQDIEGATPLHHACAVGSVDVCKMLIKYGAWIEAKDNEGETPLFYAVREGYQNVVKILVEMFGAKVDTINEDGETLFTLCHDLNDHSMSQFLSNLLLSSKNSNNTITTRIQGPYGGCCLLEAGVGGCEPHERHEDLSDMEVEPLAYTS